MQQGVIYAAVVKVSGNDRQSVARVDFKSELPAYKLMSVTGLHASSVDEAEMQGQKVLFEVLLEAAKQLDVLKVR